MLQCTLRCMYLLKLIFLFSLDKYSEVEFLSDMEVLFIYLFFGSFIFKLFEELP